MDEPSRIHLAVLLTGPTADALQRLRRRWDPAMAAVSPPHVTVAYPEEATDVALLERRSREAVADLVPFKIHLTEVLDLDEGRGGVFFSVTDPDDGIGRLRRRVLVEPFTMMELPLHATVVHPRTSDQGPSALPEVRGVRITDGCEVDRVCLTETTSSTFVVRREFLLGPGPGVRV